MGKIQIILKFQPKKLDAVQGLNFRSLPVFHTFPVLSFEDIHQHQSPREHILVLSSELPILLKSCILDLWVSFELVVILRNRRLWILSLTEVVSRQGLQDLVTPHFLHPGQCLGCCRGERQIICAESLCDKSVQTLLLNFRKNHVPKVQARKMHPQYQNHQTGILRPSLQAPPIS